ncbi:MAG: NADH-quinone oxidoreductase subunit NuoE [Bacteroidales bacterium]|nr:NADH-quinone oxidoreductase subunit NuoE [Bacteroidales bacterium]
MKIDFEALFKIYPNARREDLIPILQEIQDSAGYLSEESIVRVSRYLRLPASKVYGLATFYNQFCFDPRGKFHIEICDGTACHVEGSKLIIKEIEKKLNIKEGEITRDGTFSFQTVPCLGACGLAPVICVNGKFFPQANPEKVAEIIDKCLNSEWPE